MGGGKSPAGKGGGGGKAFHKFTDTRSETSPMEYNGDAAATVQWMKDNTNSYQLLDEVDKNSDMWAFQYWTGGRYMDGRQYGDFSAMSADDQEAVSILDSYIDRSVVNAGMTVCRGSTAELLLGKGNMTMTLEQARAMKGLTITSKSMMSAGAAAEGLPIGAGQKGVQGMEYRINVPKGAKGAGIWMGDKLVNPLWGAKQRDFVFGRDSMFTVGNAYESGGKLIVELNWVGHGVHDYG